jgi:hypothetical protein
MRLWSIHPKYLDSKGLVALWREGLLAYAVLRGQTRGYKHHPQLRRFKNHPRPRTAMKAYLHIVCDEADQRGYDFDRSKLGRRIASLRIRVTVGQLRYELDHLKKKLRSRDPNRLAPMKQLKIPEPHPLFSVVRGGIESWEKI